MATEQNPVELLERRLEDLVTRYERLRVENASLKQERDMIKERINKLVGQLDQQLEQ